MIVILTNKDCRHVGKVMEKRKQFPWEQEQHYTAWLQIRHSDINIDQLKSQIEIIDLQILQFFSRENVFLFLSFLES